MLPMEVNKNASRICQELLQTLPRRKSVGSQDAPTTILQRSPSQKTRLRPLATPQVHHQAQNPVCADDPHVSRRIDSHLNKNVNPCRAPRYSHTPSSSQKTPSRLQRRTLATQIAESQLQNSVALQLCKSVPKRQIPQSFEPMTSYLIEDLAHRRKTAWSKSITYHTKQGEILEVKLLRVSTLHPRTTLRLSSDTILYVIQGSIKHSGSIVKAGATTRLQALQILDVKANMNEDAMVLVIANALNKFVLP